MADKATDRRKARVLRDFWPSADQLAALQASGNIGNDADRVRAGTVIDVDIDTLLAGIESGILEHVKEAK